MKKFKEIKEGNKGRDRGRGWRWGCNRRHFGRGNNGRGSNFNNINYEDGEISTKGRGRRYINPKYDKFKSQSTFKNANILRI